VARAAFDVHLDRRVWIVRNEGGEYVNFRAEGFKENRLGIWLERERAEQDLRDMEAPPTTVYPVLFVEAVRIAQARRMGVMVLYVKDNEYVDADYARINEFANQPDVKHYQLPPLV